MSEMTTRPATADRLARVVRPGTVYFLGALGALLWGYDNGVIAGALLYITPAFHLTAALKGVVSSALAVGSAVGGLGCGAIAERWGRKRVVSIAGVVFLVGILLSSVSVSAAMLVAARVVIGLGIGAVAVSSPLYLAEVSPSAVRGRIGALTQLMIACGILLAYVVDFALSPFGAWRVMFAVALIPAVVLVVAVRRLPESPRWLLRQGRSAEARELLDRQMSAEEAEQTFAEISQTVEHTRISWRNMLLRPGVRRMVLTAIALAILTQLLGINTITFYAPTILKKIGFSDQASLLNSIGFGCVSVVFTVIATRVLDRWGRRPLMAVGAIVMGASMATMACLSWTVGLTVGASGFAAIGCLALFKAMYSLSWGTSTRIVIAEILPLSVRGSASGVAEVFNQASTFTLALVFPILLEAGSGAAFATFAVMGVVALLVIVFAVPETTGRRLEQIESTVVGG